MTDPTDTRAPRPSLLDGLGPRSTRRAAPRASIALAGAGCALAVAGVLVLAGDAGDGGDGSFNRVPGAVLSLLVVGAGLLVLHLARRGPLATAGAVALAAGIPAAIGFLVVGGRDGRLGTVLALAAIAWLVAYAVGPGRGRPVLLGLGLYGVWSTILEVVGGGSVVALPGLSPLRVFTSGEACSYDSSTGSTECTTTGPFGGLGGAGGYDGPDWAAVGIVSLLVGVGYLLLSRGLDRQGRHGMSSPFVFVGLLAVLQGIVSFGIELQDAQGIGALLLVTSVGLAVFGGSTHRRFTTWVGAAGTVAGIALLLLPDVDTASVAGLLLVGAGLVVVVVTHLVAEQFDEPDELADPAGPRPGPTGGGGSPREAAPADPPGTLAEPEPEWAEGSMLELGPISAPSAKPTPKRPAPKQTVAETATARPTLAKAAPAKAAPAQRAPGKTPVKKAAKKAVKSPATRTAPTKRPAKKRPPTA